jgi:hypothetical protein
MANTFTKIASVSVGVGGAATIDFTSIPSTYTDLVVKMSLRDNRIGGDFESLAMRLNSDSTASYTDRSLYAYNSAPLSAVDTGYTYIYLGGVNQPSQTANTFTSIDIYFPNYTASTNKSVSADFAAENNATMNYMGFVAGLWTKTAAISAISFSIGANSFVQYSTATLYGINKS